MATLERKPSRESRADDAGPVLRGVAVGCVVVAFAGLWLGIKFGAGIIFGFYPLLEGVAVLAAIFMPIAAARTLRRRATAWLIIGLVGAMTTSTGVGLAWWKIQNDGQHDRTVAAARALVGLRGQHGGISLAIRASSTQVLDLDVDVGHSRLANSDPDYWDIYCYSEKIFAVAGAGRATGETTVRFELPPESQGQTTPDSKHPWPYCWITRGDEYIPLHR
jgi:hypothetical protein